MDPKKNIILDSLSGWQRTHYSSNVMPEMNGEEVTLLGWVQDIRNLGGILFVILQDREGTIQITIPKKKISAELLSKSEFIQKRFSVGVKGQVKKTNMTSRGLEIIPNDLKIFATAVEQLPLDITGKTPVAIESRLDSRALDLCMEINTAIFKIQHTALVAIRGFLFERGFIEVHTPRLIASATEGGAELFSVDYFGQKAFLAQSPQLYKEQLTMSLEKVFEVGPFFRAESSHTRRHLSEFVSIDIEQAFVNYCDVMNLLEEVISYTCKKIKENCIRELNLLDYDLKVPETPFKRFTYDQVLSKLSKKGIEISWGEDISTPAFRELGKDNDYFYFITDWPTSSKAFYIKPTDDKPEICEGFDLMWRWIELVSGGTRISDKNLLIKRMQEKQLDLNSFKSHLQTFDYGLPPHAGWAIGLERLTMMLTGKKNIRETSLYPRDQMRLTP